jgi:GTPase Era involved in 16S rRNA processing
LASSKSAKLELRASKTVITEDFAVVFENARQVLLRSIDDVLQNGAAFELDPQKLLELWEYVEGDMFRVAVLGEFKRGKSTLINAMLGRPDFLPADILPSTSALIELRNGPSLRFSHRSCAPGENFVEGTEDEFRENAGAAAIATTGKDITPESAAVTIRRWRVELPNDFLARARLELVDTPGLGEDRGRDWVSQLEAQRADAAIVVLSAKQLLSLTETRLIEEMQSKAENLILAINQADGVSKDKWPGLRSHVMQRLAAQGVHMEAGRILFVSARNAEDAVRENHNNQWLSLLHDLERTAFENVLAHRGARKARQLCLKAEQAAKATREKLNHTLAMRKAVLEEVAQDEDLSRKAAARYQDAKDAVQQAVKQLSLCEGAKKELVASFDKALPKILAAARGEIDTWTSEHFELTSPKEHVKEVADHAQKAILARVEAWAKDDQEGATAVVGKALAQDIEQLKGKLTQLKNYLSASLGDDGDKLIDNLFMDALGDVFKRDLIDTDAGVALLRIGVMTAASMVVGYIVADVVLYYVLGIISGFTNPWLLVAALGASVLAYAIKGRDWVQGWIRTTVYEKLASSLSSKGNRAKIHGALREAVQDIYRQVREAFEVRANALLQEAHTQQTILEKERLLKQSMKGDPAALAAEIRHLEQVADRIERALQELELQVARLQRELGGVS